MSGRRTVRRRGAQGRKAPAGELRDRVTLPGGLERWARVRTRAEDAEELVDRSVLSDATSLEVVMLRDSVTAALTVGEAIALRGRSWLIRKLMVAPASVQPDVVVGVELISG